MQYYADRISEHLARTPQNYLLSTATPIARTGWQDYLASEIGVDGNGIVKVWRDPSEVFSPRTVASFNGMPLCENHPPVFVDANNHAAFSKGHVQNVRREMLDDGTEALIADLIITDANLIQKVEGGLREISCGYGADYEPMPDQPGAYKQVNIRGNHVAVVSNGRAGAEIRIRDDQPAALAAQPAIVAAKTKRRPMGKINNSNDGILGRMLKAFAMTDAEPEEVAEAAKLAAKSEERTEKKTTGDEEEPKGEVGPTGLGEHLSAVKDALEAHGKIMTDHMTAMKDCKDSVEELNGHLKGVKKEAAGEGAEDADLIPDPEVIPVSERPENFQEIVGDSEALVKQLLTLKPVIAATKDKKAIDNFNQALRTAKGNLSPSGENGYAAILNTGKPKGVRDAEEQEQRRREAATGVPGAESPESRAKYYENLKAGLGNKNIKGVN